MIIFTIKVDQTKQFKKRSKKFEEKSAAKERLPIIA